MAYTCADQALALRHVEEGAQRIADLRLCIADSKKRSHPTALFERALDTILVTHELMKDHLVAIEAALAASDVPPISN